MPQSYGTTRVLDFSEQGAREDDDEEHDISETTVHGRHGESSVDPYPDDPDHFWNQPGYIARD